MHSRCGLPRNGPDDARALRPPAERRLELREVLDGALGQNLLLLPAVGGRVLGLALRALGGALARLCLRLLLHVLIEEPAQHPVAADHHLELPGTGQRFVAAVHLGELQRAAFVAGQLEHAAAIDAIVQERRLHGFQDSGASAGAQRYCVRHIL